MPAVIENLQLACAICKIGIYSLFRRLCCKPRPPPRPEFGPVCIGLTRAGKTTLLCQLCGHSLEDIQPTSGFEIKACQFKHCILNVKEIGGGEKIVPYWKHYYKGADAVIFVFDSAGTEEHLEEVHKVLHTALDDPQLRFRPCLILANCQDKPGARSREQIRDALDLEVLENERDIVLHLCDKDNVQGLREGFETFNNLLVSPGNKTDSPESKDINRI